MRKMQWIVLLIALLVLGACNNQNEKGEAPEEDKIGFSLTGNSIEEAENIPEEDKAAILSAFDQYITMFNEKNWDAYMEMISDNSDSFDKKEEEAYIDTFFEEYDLVREPSDVTIVKYKEGEAQVFSILHHQLKQLSTGLEKEEEARQVTVFTKENNEWKVKSVHSIGENPAQE